MSDLIRDANYSHELCGHGNNPDNCELWITDPDGCNGPARGITGAGSEVEIIVGSMDGEFDRQHRVAQIEREQHMERTVVDLVSGEPHDPAAYCEVCRGYRSLDHSCCPPQCAALVGHVPTCPRSTVGKAYTPLVEDIPRASRGRAHDNGVDYHA